MIENKILFNTIVDLHSYLRKNINDKDQLKYAQSILYYSTSNNMNPTYIIDINEKYSQLWVSEIEADVNGEMSRQMLLRPELITTLLHFSIYIEKDIFSIHGASIRMPFKEKINFFPNESYIRYIPSLKGKIDLL
jgi:hypothetical protein